MTLANRRNANRQITAIFSDRRLSFDLPEEATFEDLVDCLAYLGDTVGGTPLRVDVRFPA